MDEEIPLDDIRWVTKLLSEGSLARIEATKAEAVAELLADLSRYWESVAVSKASLREHDPSELIPFFEKYAERQYDSYAEELLPHSSDLDRYGLYLSMNVMDAISYEIRPERYFMPKNVCSGDWSELVRLLKDCEPELREQRRKELSDPSGDWEIYLYLSFERHMLKTGGRFRSRDDAEATNLLFQMKYLLRLRLFINWSDFDMRLRAHVSNRLAHWQAQAYRRAARQTDEAAHPSLGPSEVRGSVAERVEEASRQTAAPVKSDRTPAAERVPSVTDIKAALNIEDRKKAVKLRCILDRCTITELWSDAFKSRGWAVTTKRTAFNRWQASRRDAPSWADEFMRKRLLR